MNLLLTVTTCLNTYQPHALVRNEIIESPNGITPSPNTCDDRIRQLPLLLSKLSFDLPPDHSLKISYDGRERMGTDSRSYEVMCRI